MNATTIATTSITKSDIPDYAPATIKLPNGWSAEITTEYDPCNEPPWKVEDGHGPVEEAWQNVRGFVSRRRTPESKRPGERVLRDYHGELIAFYDFAGAVKRARAEGWRGKADYVCGYCGRDGNPWGSDHHERYAGDIEPQCVGFRPMLRGTHRILTAGEIAVIAAEHDFERMRGWCLGPDGGGWGWIGVIVTVRDAEGAEVEEKSLWGIESDGDYWREVAAELVNELAAGRVMPNYGTAGEQTEVRHA